MRLIEALIDQIESDIKAIEDENPVMAMGAIGVLNTIKKAPTALEVVHCKDYRWNETCCRNIRPEGRRQNDFCSYGEK